MSTDAAPEPPPAKVPPHMWRKVQSEREQRIIDATVKVKFVPCGEWESLAVLFPYAATVPGTSIFTGSDVPLTIESLTSDKDKVVVKAAAVTKCPDIILGAKETLFGEVEFTGVPADDTEWDDADRLLAVTTNGAAPSASGFATASIITQGYTAAGANLGSFETYDGFRITFRWWLYDRVEKGYYRINQAIGAIIAAYPSEEAIGGLYVTCTGATEGRPDAAMWNMPARAVSFVAYTRQ